VTNSETTSFSVYTATGFTSFPGADGSSPGSTKFQSKWHSIGPKSSGRYGGAEGRL